MKDNPILDELRRFRDAHAKKFNYNLAAMCEDLRLQTEKLKKQGWKFVKPPRRRRSSEKKTLKHKRLKQTLKTLCLFQIFNP